MYDPDLHYIHMTLKSIYNMIFFLVYVLEWDVYVTSYWVRNIVWSEYAYSFLI